MKQKLQFIARAAFFWTMRKCVAKVSIKHCVKSYECDSDGRLKLLSLMNLLQEVAEKHIALLGLGVDFCRELGFAWVATKYNIKINRYPLSKEKIKIVTWCSERPALTAIRDTVIVDGKGKILVQVSSQWSLISITKRRLVSIAATLPRYRVLNRKNFEDPFKRIKMFEKGETTKEFLVKRDYIDFNKHVNNALYPVWATEAVESQLGIVANPVEININFRKEALYGEKIRVETQKKGMTTLHRIQTADGERDLSFIRIQWA